MAARYQELSRCGVVTVGEPLLRQNLTIPQEQAWARDHNQKGAACAAPRLLTIPVRQATLTLYGVVASTFGR